MTQHLPFSFCFIFRTENHCGKQPEENCGTDPACASGKTRDPAGYGNEKGSNSHHDRPLNGFTEMKFS